MIFIAMIFNLKKILLKFLSHLFLTVFNEQFKRIRIFLWINLQQKNKCRIIQKMLSKNEYER